MYSFLGQEVQARREFQKAFDLIENFNYSPSYYYRTYNRFFLSSDLAPQLLRGEIAPEMIESFAMLAQELEGDGDQAEAQLVRQRLEVEQNPYGATDR